MVDFLAGLGWQREVATFVALALGGVAVCTFGLLWLALVGIWLERKIWSRIQDRIGPNRTGPYGLLQTFADVAKLLMKEDITPVGADRAIFNLAPLLAVAAVLMIWAVIPFSAQLVGADLNIGILYVMAVGSFATLAILLAGWSSNNKFALLGAFRIVAQMISYEVPMLLAVVPVVLLAGTMSMQGLIQAQSIGFGFAIPISFLLFFVSSLAEVGRPPFDLLDAESELVAGYNIEYSGMKWGMFFAGEFLHAFTISVLAAVMFLGGWRGPGAELGGVAGALIGFGWLLGKTLVIYFVIVLLRMTVPRMRIDQMMAFNWKFLVPLALANLIIVAVGAGLSRPDYEAARQAVAAGGLGSFIGGILGAGFIAELPRTVLLFVASVALWRGANRLLRRTADGQRAAFHSVPYSAPAVPASAMTPPLQR